MAWTAFVIIIVIVCVQSVKGECSHCECFDGECRCEVGYVPNYQRDDCVKCPGIGKKCYGPCCSTRYNESLQCWRGTCQNCYGPYGNWVCRDSMDQMVFVSGSQIVMAVALVLGIIATFTLLYKLCAVRSLRPLGSQASDGRLSIGSLQIYVNERLRDAPPRYSRAPASGSAIYPATVFLNAGFVHDNSLPPPPYTERKSDNEINTAIHM